jgi:ABC-2 type transport system permease protein
MVTVNAVNGMKGGLGNSYLMQIVMQYAQNIAAEQGIIAKRPVTVEPRYLFNASLDYKSYMIPALMAMTLILLVGFLPALNVVGEKERGTIEQINVTPVSRLEFILSKMIPYWTVGIFKVGFSSTGVAKAEDVTAAAITTRRILFTPETERIVVGQKKNSQGKVVQKYVNVKTLIKDVVFEETHNNAMNVEPPTP